MISNSAIPLITLPTRVTAATSTIIDHIITNDLKHKITPFVIRNDLTDHYITVCNIKQIIHCKRAKPPKYHRDTSKLNREDFCNELDQNLSQYFLNCDVLNHLNYNIIFNGFVDVMRSTVDAYAPIRQLSRRQTRLKNKPWLTKELLALIRKRRLMFCSHFLQGDENEKASYRKF